MMMDIEKIQEHLKEHELDGWLMADFHARNDVAVEMLRLKGVLTRRSFYFIPVEGTPTGLIPEIEKGKFAHLPGELKPFAGYRSMEIELASLMEGCKWVAMEYSRMGRLPYIGLVDAGTVEMVRSMGVEIVSSADLVAAFQARLSEPQIAAHREAAANLMEIKDGAFPLIARSLTEGKPMTEYDVSQYILARFKENGMVCEFDPICAVDGNAGNPHYQPTAQKSETIQKGQLILIDLWAKLKTEDGIYGDITWMAYAGTKEVIPEKYVSMFDVIVRARDAAISFMEESMQERPVYGSEVDDACRAVVVEAGFGDYFTHRTGHSIGTHGHGSGPNIDNLETEDRRILQSGHLFSIEPGIYMDDCGFRTEIDCLITDGGCEVTTLPRQTGILALL
jgi:Xaa-Pro aminopeptidase